MEQNKVDIKELRERFSVSPEQVAEEILECPHEAVGDNLVLVAYQPEYKTNLNIIFTDKDDEPSNKKVPMAWVVSIGESAKNLLGIKEGDLVKYAGMSQHDYTNGKVYLLMHRVNVLCKTRIDKVKSWK